MKLLMGFIVLLVALVAVTGCTQTASPSAQITTTTVPLTEVTTAAPTVATTVPVTTETMVANATAPAANVTAASTNVTAAATTAPALVASTPTPGTAVPTILITSTGFTPQTDVLITGTGITWMNTDNVSHAITVIGNNTGMFNSGAIVPNGGFTYTFGQPGTFTYALVDNQTVTGTIIVQVPNTVLHGSL